MLRRERGLGLIPPVLLFHSAEAAEAEPFFEERWPDLRAIADPELFFFDALGVPRGSLGQLFGLRALVAGTAALFRGVFPGRPQGDVLRMPGLFVVAGQDILWQQRFASLGEPPDLDSLRAAVQAYDGRTA